jgi:alpha-L-rhamnosidase-like protein
MVSRTNNRRLYQTLVTASRVATWKGDAEPSLISLYNKKAKDVKDSINNRFYSVSGKAYMDSPSRSQLYPQDANAMAILFNITTPGQKYDVSRTLKKNWRLYGPESPELPRNVSPFITSLELHAHFSLGDTIGALDLLRRTWGWYLEHPNGTQSTMIEGYRVDGTFGYRSERGYKSDASYVSHSHGWSTGPTSALTKYIAGLDILDRAGSQWSFSPQFGGLDFAEAGFMTKLGSFRTKWALNTGTGGGYNVTIETPHPTRGVVHLPSLKGTGMVITIDKEKKALQEDGTGVTFRLAGGPHNITVRPSDEPPEPSNGGSWWPW